MTKNTTVHNFNPRSREGSDWSNPAMMTPLRYFNPRSREGSDSALAEETTESNQISIHAPVKGATEVLG